MRPQFVLLPLAIPIAATFAFVVVPANARIPAFLALIGLGAAIVLGAKQKKL